MLECEFKVNRFLLGYCRRLTADLPDERFAEQPLPDVNHPAWILGHLAFSADRIGEILGAARDFPPTWLPLFGPGSKLSALRSDYPSRDELLHAVEQRFERARQRVEAATPDQLAQPSTNPSMKDALPTLRDGVAFLLTGHLGVHLGQLSSWRRMIGLPPLF